MLIDLVYLWVDGNDPEWQAKKRAFTGNISAVNSNDRYSDNDELKYSLRSIEKYAPWINRVFIVLDSRPPCWLNTNNPKIKIVNSEEILSESAIPCFNSVILEHHLYKLAGLSEHFIYANDDMLLNKPVSPDVFFNKNGFPIIRFIRKPLRQFFTFYREKILRKKPLQYRKTIANASDLVKGRFGVYYSGMPHHNIDSYLKSDQQRVAEEMFHKEITTTFTNHVRNFNDIQRVIYQYVALAEKRGTLRYVSEKESIFVGLHNDKQFKKLENTSPIFFCMNDNVSATDQHRNRMKEWLEKRFPEKSSFERS